MRMGAAPLWRSVADLVPGLWRSANFSNFRHEHSPAVVPRVWRSGKYPYVVIDVRNCSSLFKSMFAFLPLILNLPETDGDYEAIEL